jgi:hypothetical protein
MVETGGARCRVFPNEWSADENHGEHVIALTSLRSGVRAAQSPQRIRQFGTLTVMLTPNVTPTSRWRHIIPAMEHRVRVTYDRDTLTDAAHRIAIHTIGPVGVVVWVLLVALLLQRVVAGERSVFVGALGAFVVLVAFYYGAAFVGAHRRAVASFDRLSDKTSELVFTEHGFSIRYDLGYREWPWRAVAEVWRTKRSWIVIFTAWSGYLTLPIADVSDQTRMFVLEQVARLGGRVR